MITKNNSLMTCVLVATFTLSGCATFKKKEFVQIGQKRYLIAAVYVPGQPEKVLEYEVYNENTGEYVSCGDTRDECLDLLRDEQELIETESVPEFIRKPEPKPKPDPFAPPQEDTLGPVEDEETSFGD